MPKVRSRPVFTNVRSECMVKHRSTVQRRVRRIKVAGTGRAALVTYSGVVALELQQCMTTSVGLKDGYAATLA